MECEINRKISINELMETHRKDRTVCFYTYPCNNVAKSEILREEMGRAIRESICGPTLFLCEIRGPLFELFALEVLRQRAEGSPCQLAVVTIGSNRFVGEEEKPFYETADFVVSVPPNISGPHPSRLKILQMYSSKTLCYLFETQARRIGALNGTNGVTIENLHTAYIARLRAEQAEPKNERPRFAVRDIFELFLLGQPVILRCVADGKNVQECTIRDISAKFLNFPVVRLSVGEKGGLVIYIDG